MRISVLIPALNERAHIERAVRSSWEAGAAEVIVADGGSGDGTAELAASAGAAVVSSPPGRARQQNAAAAQASGDVLLFLHADNWLSAGVAQQVREALADERRLHGAFLQQIDSENAAYRLLERGNAARVRWLGLPYGDQAIFLRRVAFREAGGFTDAPLMEDVLLMQQLRRRAWPLLLPGPVHVSPRRWQRHGIVRQTLRNWSLLAAFSLGASPHALASWYRRHDDLGQIGRAASERMAEKERCQ